MYDLMVSEWCRAKECGSQKLTGTVPNIHPKHNERSQQEHAHNENNFAVHR